MAEELLSLKWNNHQTHFVDILTFLREQEIFIDVTLACGGKLYPTHKFVLSTCSDYFKEMFTRVVHKHPIVFMKDVSCTDLEALLDFMYNGEVNVPQSSLGSLIKTAEGLQVKGLAVPDDPPLPRDRTTPPAKRKRTHSPPKEPPTPVSRVGGSPEERVFGASNGDVLGAVARNGSSHSEDEVKRDSPGQEGDTDSPTLDDKHDLKIKQELPPPDLELGSDWPLSGGESLDPLKCDQDKGGALSPQGFSELLGSDNPSTSNNDVTAMANSTGVGNPAGQIPRGPISSTVLRLLVESAGSVVTNVGKHIEDHRPFGCDFCDGRFKKKQHLQNHTRIHTGEKYVCTDCGRAFSRRHILMHHVHRKHQQGK